MHISILPSKHVKFRFCIYNAGVPSPKGNNSYKTGSTKLSKQYAHLHIAMNKHAFILQLRVQTFCDERIDRNKAMYLLHSLTLHNNEHW